MRQTIIVLVSAIAVCTTTNLNAQVRIPAPQQQIKAAVAAAPDHLRAQAKVYGYTPNGAWTVLREGSNKFVCIADDPQQQNFHVACYHKALEPFMKRGRELRAQGLVRTEVDKTRRQEIKSGQLSFPDKPMALYSLTGAEDAYNYEAGTVTKATPLYVVYIPFATEATTGIAATPPAPGAPWLMEAGLPEAHIMYAGDPIGTAVQN